MTDDGTGSLFSTITADYTTPLWLAEKAKKFAENILTSLESIKSLRFYPIAGRAKEISVIPGADRMSAIPVRMANGPHDQLSATVGADALWAVPDNAGRLAGLIPAVYAKVTPA